MLVNVKFVNQNKVNAAGQPLEAITKMNLQRADFSGENSFRFTITKAEANRLAIKLMYWNLNTFKGEAWGDAHMEICYMGVYFRVENIDIAGMPVKAQPYFLVDYITAHDRDMQFVY